MKKMLQKQLDEAGTPIFMMGKDLRFSFFNKVWLSYRGMSLAKELKNHPENFVNEADLKKFLDMLKACAKNLRPCSLDFRLLKKDGEYRWFHAVVVPQFNQDEEFQAFIGYCDDSNEKKLAEEHMRRLSAVFANADAGIVLKDKEGVILEWNVGAQNILGYPAEEVIGKTTKDYSPNQRTEEIIALNKIVTTGEHLPHLEIVRKHKDGHFVHCSASLTPVFGPDGEVTGSITIFHDITEQKKAESKMRSLAAIVSIADAGFIVKNRDGVISDWNVGAQNILGYTPEEIIGKTTKDYAPEEGAAEIDDINERLMQGEHIAHREVIRKHKDGRLIDCSASYTPLFDQQNDIIGSVAIFHDISEKIRIEKKQKALEKTLSNIFDNMFSAFCLYEAASNPNDGAAEQDLRILLANKAYADFVRRPHDSLEGLLFSEVCSGEVEWLPSYLMVANTGVTRSFERYSYFFKKHLGVVLYSPVIGQVAVVMTDRTHIVEAELALKERENDLALLFSSMTTGFCLGKIVRDDSGTPVDIIFEMVNDAFEMLEGYKGSDIIGRKLYETNPEADKTFLPIYAEIVAKQSRASFIKNIPSLGKTLEVVCYSPREGYFACVENDVSQRVKAEAELKKSYTDTKAILDEIPAPICVAAKSNGIILGCNAAFIIMCRADSEKSILGHPLSDFLQLDDETRLEEAIKKLVRGTSFNGYMKRLDGLQIELDVFARPFMYDDQEAFAVHCLDLTKQKAHEQALLDAARAAEGASELKSTFLANMSHEIRTPMNGVIGLAELALDESGVSDQMRDYLRKIKNSATGLLSIINDILDLSKIEAGKVALEKIPFSLHHVFKECEEISSIKAEEKSIMLFFYAEPEINRRLLGDPTKLRQILLNLLSNAIKFTNRGIVKMLSLASQEADGRIKVHFEVKDSGIGMTAEQIARIFDPFTQGDNSTTRKHGGTGLGLSITKNLIELMGGELSVESLPGIGSKFSFTLFFEPMDAPEPQEVQHLGQANKQAKPIFKGDVLVCEDNTINQQVIREHLRKIGFEVTIVDNGRKGVEAVNARLDRPFDIILMDIHMPEMDGLEATYHLREMGCKTPIIAVTANAMTKDREIFLGSGMTGYLCKPFKAHELWDMLQQFLTPVTYSFPGSDQGKEGQGAAPSVIDRKIGIERAADDEGLYLRLQSDFYHSNQNVLKELLKCIQENDIKSAHRIAHTLKGVAATIGALALSSTAQIAENTLAQKGQLDKEQIANLEQRLKEVLDELALSVPTKEHKESAPGELNKEKATALINKLKPLLKNGNSESQDYLDQVEELLSPVGEKGITLIRQIEDYEFEDAFENICEIEKVLEA